MTHLIDISPAVHPGLAVWPGDVAYERSVALSFAQGHHLELSSIRTTVHVGAHADAPNHYVAEGAGIAARSLEPYYGPCQVLSVEVPRGHRVGRADLPGPVTAPRLLLRTGTFPDPTQWNEDFAAFDPALIDHLAAQGCVLVGLDTPSVDLMHSKDLPAHQALARHDLAVLEGLVLDHVPDGLYTLVALPLKLVGADASPVRAALLSP